MKYAFVLLACALPLLTVSACSREPEVDMKNASAQDVANELAEAGGTGVFLSPGKWQASVTIEQMAIPGMPAEMAEKMKGMAGRTQSQETCLTPEEAKRPSERMFAGNDKNCRYDRFTMADGKIDALMKCSANGATQTMTMAGTYSGETYNMQMTTEASGGGSNAGMTMKMRVDAKRVGECDGKTA